MIKKDTRSFTDAGGHSHVLNSDYTYVRETRNDFVETFDNRQWRKRIRNGGVVGGPFNATKRRTIRIPTHHMDIGYPPGSANAGLQYSGVFWTTWTPPGANASTSDLSAWGATAYSKLKPTKPSFSAINSILELRELPDLIFKLQLRVRDVGKTHLAGQFGWVPLVNDIKSLIKLQMNAQRRLKWLLDNNGKPIRREVKLFEDTITSGPSYWTGGTGFLSPGALLPSSYKHLPKLYTSQTEYTRIWASARFRYWLPPGPRDIEWDKKMLYRLYGVRLPPSTIYNAIPWTWLIDWFTNLGDIIDNLDPGVADRLAADYLYLMRTVERESRLDLVATLYTDRHGNSAVINTSTINFFSEKKRIVGNPFGFSVSQTPLSAMQLSILGALGLSRL